MQHLTAVSFTIFVRHGKSVAFPGMEDGTKVGDLVEKVAKAGFGDATLQYNGKALNPSLTLRECGLGDDVDVQLVQKGRGGGCKPSKQSALSAPEQVVLQVASPLRIFEQRSAQCGMPSPGRCGVEKCH